MKTSVLAVFAAAALSLGSMSLVQAQEAPAAPTTQTDPAVECPAVAEDAVENPESLSTYQTNEEETDMDKPDGVDVECPLDATAN